MRRTIVVLWALTATAWGCLAAGEAASAADAPAQRVVVMYFHRTERCPTCQKMGRYAEEAVKGGFGKEMAEGKVRFHFIDFQDEKNAAYTKAYKITGPALIVAKATGKKAKEYKDLKEIWMKVSDRDEFVEYVRTNVSDYLK